MEKGIGGIDLGNEGIQGLVPSRPFPLFFPPSLFLSSPSYTEHMHARVRLRAHTHTHIHLSSSLWVCVFQSHRLSVWQGDMAVKLTFL